MAVPISTWSGDRKKLEQKNKKRKVRQHTLLIWSALTIIAMSVFIFQVACERIPVAVAIENLPPANLLHGTDLEQEEILHEDTTQNLVVPADLEDNPEVEETAVPVVEEHDPLPSQTSVPTQAQLNAYAKNAPITYYAQSGDSLGILAVRFGVEVAEIRSTVDFMPDQLIPEGQVLFIPHRLDERSPREKVFPDSEVVNSPSAVGFDVKAYVNQAGGYLASYSETIYDNGMLSGAEIVEKIAVDYSIHPRLLLALIEHKSNWVYGVPQTQSDKAFPLGIKNLGRPGLHSQLIQAAGILGRGYYGWREGHTLVVTFKDGQTLRLAGELNAGSVALMHFFASQSTVGEWLDDIYGENSFPRTYERMFDDPWRTASQFEPLISADVVQPELILPFDEGVTWAMTVGPHAAWGSVDVYAALDFAPPMAEPGCGVSYSWIASASEGLVVRSNKGVVVVDLDGDGNEQTGWVIVYLHVGNNNRVGVGEWLMPGDHIGHPSCEGGMSTGTHVHIARKYNGEWVPADGPMPFIMSGWRAVMDPISLGGWLVKGEEIVKASLFGAAHSHIKR